LNLIKKEKNIEPYNAQRVFRDLTSVEFDEYDDFKKFQKNNTVEKLVKKLKLDDNTEFKDGIKKILSVKELIDSIDPTS
jgi:gamma-glutamyl phosphate reductase